ncbi:MAG: DUF523 domain-containing protein, partial [Planctomycetota bacterium]
FDGGDKKTPDLLDALQREGVEIVAFCPEEEGGLGTPRPAAVIEGGDGEDVLDGNARVVTRDGGRDVTDAYLEGARRAAERAAQSGCKVAYLKERSPSCGCALVHTSTGLVRGCGVTTAMLRRAGVAPVSVA